MDVNNSYMKPQDFIEIDINERKVKIFTINQNNLWFLCIYDEKLDIAWRNPHLDYQKAYNDFVTFVRLFSTEQKRSLKDRLLSLFK